MYSKAQIALKYLNYYFRASDRKGHGVHSPFVFEFITRVLNDATIYPPYTEVEELRRKVLRDSAILHVIDLGAGSAISHTNQRTVASVARTAVKSRKLGQLLFRMVRFYHPRTVIELGTSLGITTSYFAKGNSAGKVITIEGSKEILEVARKNFAALGLQNIETIEGNFDSVLPDTIRSIGGAVDFAFIDGNHRMQPTIQYFNTILPGLNNFSIVILDDIHWSEEMEKAWLYCKEHPSVTLSIDLFFMGILIFRKEIREKQHFSIRF